VKVIPHRFLPGQDLKKSCFQFFKDQNNSAFGGAAIVSAVGSLSQAHLRLANAKATVELMGPFEIVALSGTLSLDGVHLHIALADQEGRVIGGHLMDHCIIHTTAEIVFMFLSEHKFSRELDLRTGFKELKVL